MAQVDTSMYNALGVRPKSIGEYSAELDAADLRKQGMQQNALALRMGQQKLGEYERGLQDENALRQVVSGFGADPSQNVMKLFGAGRLSEAQAYQKSIDESKKAGAAATKDVVETEKMRLANGLQKFEVIGQVMSGVNDQASYDRARLQIAQNFGPEAAANIPPVYNPQLVAENQAKAMSVKEQMEARLKEIQFAEASRHNRATEGLTARGQNITRDAAQMGGTVQVASDGTMVVVPNKMTPGRPVQSSPVVGPDGKPMQSSKGAGGQPSEDERKAAGYAIRMEGALKKLEEVGKTDPGALTPGVGTSLINMAPEGLANYMRSGARQRVETAQVDALDAALTLATGAAYTKEQLKGLSRSYFTQPGDDAATIKDKEQRLAEVIETARIRAGRAAPDITKMADQRKTDGGQPVKVTSDADYNALKPGTRFVTPDGKTGTKR